MDREALAKVGDNSSPGRSCWGRRTSLEKILLGVLVLLTAFTLALVTLMVVLAADFAERSRDPSVNSLCPSAFTAGGSVGPRHQRARRSSDQVQTTEEGGNATCETRQCVAAAQRMLEIMNSTADPCVNFHEYACGGWTKKHGNNVSLTYSIFGNELVSQVDNHLKTLLEKEDKPQDGEPASFQKARDFYSSCMSEKVITERGFHPAKALLDTMGKIHDNDTWTEGAADLTELIYQMLIKNGAPFFDVQTGEKVDDPLKEIATITLPTTHGVLQHYKDVKENNHEIAERKRNRKIDDELVKATATTFKVRRDSNETVDATVIYNSVKDAIHKQADSKVHEILQRYFERNATDPQQAIEEEEFNAFISDLRNIIPTTKERKFVDEEDKTFLSFTLGDIQKMTNQIDWKALLQKLFKRTFEDQDLIQVEYWPYLEKLQKVLDKHGPRIVNNAALALFARDVLWDLVNVTKNEQTERWEFCLEKTKKVLSTVLSAMYVRDFDREVLGILQKDAEEMFDHFKQSLIEAIEEKEWMDKESKDISRQKVEGMAGFFVNSDMLYNDTFVNETVKDLNIEKDRFFENVINAYVHLLKEAYNMNISHIGHDNIEKHPLASPFVVNAFYLPNYNKIVLTLATLTPPFFSHDDPKYITYANLGNTIGHEISHAFDTTGIKYNVKGERKPWLTTGSKQKFQAKNQCVIEMYRNTFSRTLEFSGRDVAIKFDGKFTLDENLADIAGIKLALDAYQLWEAEHGEEKLLPELDLSTEQLFYLSAAQSSCSVVAPLGYFFSLEVDNHTPEPERVNAFLMNSKRFAEAFHCPVGSPMNPTSKCKV